MHIIKFTQLFQLNKNSKHLTFFLPNANLNSDFHTCIAIGGFHATPTSQSRGNTETTRHKLQYE